MKKHILSVAILFATITTSFAQKGTVLVYGDLNHSSIKVGSVSESATRFRPAVGYQFNESMTAGITSSFAKNDVAVGPFIRKAWPINQTFAFYTQLEAQYLNQKNSGIKANGFGMNLFPALFINFKDSFGLNFGIGNVGFSTLKSDLSGSNNINAFNLSLGSGVSFGISKNF